MPSVQPSSELPRCGQGCARSCEDMRAGKSSTGFTTLHEWSPGRRHYGMVAVGFAWPSSRRHFQPRRNFGDARAVPICLIRREMGQPGLRGRHRMRREWVAACQTPNSRESARSLLSSRLHDARHKVSGLRPERGRSLLRLRLGQRSNQRGTGAAEDRQLLFKWAALGTQAGASGPR
jgi:hypothetical protein